ncbi:endonuclease/exonuclease/phosphatase family metal-dependent hydrolase [Tamaricihabitans halophyticus]|uniref:Endonuclease/exonuclease/phosphatase family metal-dependent hydrolase n=1 Tax=Tamaricihabitans halophyticus TaxID=1262583 RepID=A0A4R2Q4Q0_9PSEU|nr:sphingomyelin phosphodiesterase [Tamaricihabitans halophyticus]TCP43449.1 endonuclease/exonuclease/phosphatase family metal-dependent hydrolase [Tamaricihabitans halophyticus]
MRRLAALVTLVGAALAMAPIQAAAAPAVSVLSLNLWQLPGIAGQNPTDKEARAQAAEQVIRANDAEVVVLQEAFSKQAESLRQRLVDVWPYRTPLVGQYCSTEPGWSTVEGDCSKSPFVVNGGVTVLSKRPITESHQLVFRKSYRGTADYYANKGAALARIDVDGRPLWVTGTHLQADEGSETLPKAHEVRMAQLGELSDLVARHVPAADPVVLGADLNVEYWAGQDRKDEQGRTQIQQAEAAINGVLRTSPEGEYTYDALTNSRAAESVDPDYRDSLDYIGALGGSGRPLADVGPVSKVGYDNGAFPSDHYPVRATVTF